MYGREDNEPLRREIAMTLMQMRREGKLERRRRLLLGLFGPVAAIFIGVLLYTGGVQEGRKQQALESINYLLERP